MNELAKQAGRMKPRAKEAEPKEDSTAYISRLQRYEKERKCGSR